jgi:hypothetical protein
MRMRIGRFVALVGACCCPAAACAGASPPDIAPAPARAVAFKKRRLDIRASTATVTSPDANTGRLSDPSAKKFLTDVITLNTPRLAIPDGAWGPRDEAGIRYATATIRTSYADFPNWTNPVRVTVRNKNGSIDVVGLERPA